MTFQYYNLNESNKTHSNTQKIVASFYGDRTLETIAIATSQQSKPFDRGIAVLDKSRYQHSGDRAINPSLLISVFSSPVIDCHIAVVGGDL